MPADDAAGLHARFHALLPGLTDPPGFREESGDHPLVYGYVRCDDHGPDQVRLCRRAIDGYCAWARVGLSAVFVDRHTPADGLRRPGLTALCDVLSLPDSFAAVLVDLGHLSPVPAIAAGLVQRIRDTGARLLLVDRSWEASGQGMDTADRLAKPSVPQWWQS